MVPQFLKQRDINSYCVPRENKKRFRISITGTKSIAAVSRVFKVFNFILPSCL